MSAPTPSSHDRPSLAPLLLVLAALVLVQFAALSLGLGHDLQVARVDLGEAVRGGQVFALLATAVLLWRIVLVARYRPTPGCGDARLPSVAVIVPAYNEGRQVHTTLHSLASSDYPKDKLRVIAIDDGSVDDTWAWMSQAARELGDDVVQVIRCPRNGGKRRALYEGFRRTEAEVIVTVDSDSVVLSDTLRNLVAPLVADPRVGAVAGNVRVLNAEAGAIARMLDVTFTHAFEFMRASESQVDAVMCCPGALSAYRRALVDAFRDQWVGETFMGVPAGIGEDRSMTNHVLRRGHLVRFQANAIVLTTVPTRTAQLSRMLLRWGRSNVREGLVMAGFAFGRFRSGSMTGARVNLALSMFTTVASGLSFVPTVAVVMAQPMVLPWMVVAGMLSGMVPALVYASIRTPGRALWAFPYGLYSLLCLSWITPLALVTPHRSAWLTRQLPPARRHAELAEVAE